MNYNKLIPELLSSRKKPYPVHEYNFKSSKYNYIYNESVNNITYWHGRLQYIIYYVTKYGTDGFTSWDYYSDSEEGCAKELYKTIKKHIKKLSRENKRYANRNKKKHINWQNWLINYENIIK